MKINEMVIRRRLKQPKEEDILRGIEREEDYKSPIGRNKTLYINLKFVKFGVSDRLQGAAIFLSIILLVLTFVVLVIGLFNLDWAKEVLGWLSSPLMLAIGVAVGRSGKGDSEEN